jgi:heme-degrading monooxygenase HmoA
MKIAPRRLTMPTVNQANGLLAEFAIFPSIPDQQVNLVERVVQTIESKFKQKPGFSGATVLASRDGLRVTSYIQWRDRDQYQPSQPLVAGADIHLFEIFAAEPQGSAIQLAVGMSGLINFGIFKMKQPENQPRFIELFRQALDRVSRQPGLISTHAHRSLDGWRCINFGHWRSLEDYTAMDSDRPFAALFSEMLALADNEYQKSLHEVVFTT